MPRVVQLLEEHRPDIVCLQETKCADDAFPAVELEAAGYGAVHHSGGRWAGVAVLARRPLSIADDEVGLAGEPDATEARWVEAAVDGIRVASVYVPNGRAVGTPPFTA